MTRHAWDADLPEPEIPTRAGRNRRILGRPAHCTHTGCRTVIAQPGEPVPNPCRCPLHEACGEYGDGVHPCLDPHVDADGPGPFDGVMA